MPRPYRRTALRANFQKPTTDIFNLCSAKHLRHTHDSRRTTGIEAGGDTAIGDALLCASSDEIED